MNYKEELLRHGLEIPYGTDKDILLKPLRLYGKKIHNRIGILPLEGFDSKEDGSPSEYVYRRYLRFVEGGAGLIWFEACAVSEDGKSNPMQMMLHKDNVATFHELIEKMDRRSEQLGRERCFKVLQLTHSGRVSKDGSWNAIPLSPKKVADDDSAEVASDEKITRIIDEHIRAAELATQAGFDAVDVKVCHGYFLSELLSAYNREGRYGGSFENRTRAIFEIIDGIKEAAGDKIGICVRLNAYDSEAYPDGYGVVKENGKLKADLSETIKLCTMLRDKGVQLINISASSPSERIFGVEPEDVSYKKYGASCDYLAATKILKENVDGVCFMCTGLSSFGAEGGYVAIGGIEENWFDIAGFGRQALAYPGFAFDLLEKGKMEELQCCVNCNQCYKLMDPGRCRTGCVVRDSAEIYPFYSKYVLGK